MTRRPRLYIEGGALSEAKMSGIGHTLAALLQALAARNEFLVTVIVPFNKLAIARSRIPENCAIKKIYIPGRIMNGLTRFNLLPWMDLFFGRGVYLFPNFKNWPLLFSPAITYVHDVYFKVQPEHIEPRNLDLLQRNLGRFIRRSKVIVTVSNHAKSEIERYFPESKGRVVVVYNAIDHTRYYPRSVTEQSAAAKKYGLAVKRYFMYLSNLEPRKNVDTLLEGFKSYVDQTGDKDTALLLVGGMSWGSELLVKKLSSLQREGYAIIKPASYVPDDDIPALLSGAIALIHPATYEGFGIPPLEAMACGVSVIVGRNTSLPEVMGPNFKNYVDVMSPQALMQAMIQLHSSHNQDNAYGIARAKDFDWSTSAVRLSRIIEDIQ